MRDDYCFQKEESVLKEYCDLKVCGDVQV